MDEANDDEGHTGDECGGGDGEDPGPDDASGDAPSNGGKAVSRTYSHNCSRDGVGRADRDSGQSGGEERDGASGFGTESTDGFELGDAGSHGMDDAPSAEVSAKSDGGVSGKDDRPVEMSPCAFEFGGGNDIGAEQGAGNNAHGLLSVVASVTEAVGGG